MENETIGFFERIMHLKDHYGIWNLVKVVLFIGFSVSFLYLAKNFGENFSWERQKDMITETIVDHEQNKIEQHSEQMSRRGDIRPIVQGVLQNTINQMNADRAFVMELHNGSNNTSGLPFIHFSMTYEEVAKGIESIDEDYQGISLSRFSFPNYLVKHEIWFGTIEEFEEIDTKAASRLRHNDVTYIVLTSIETENCQIGYYGFTYCNGKKPKDKKDIVEFVVGKVQKLSRLLDNNVTDY